jgi:hypothetical protein
VGEDDRALVESVQRGVVSCVVDRGRLLPESERLIALFHTKVTLLLTEGPLLSDLAATLSR